MRFSQSRMMSRAVVLQVARIEGAQVVGLLRPAERRERPQRRREPRVEHVLARGVSSPEPHSAHASGSVSAHVHVAVRALPHGQLVAPPDLPGDVPVGRLLERRDREAVLRLRMEDARAAERSASSAGCFSSSIEHHHCGEIQRLDPAVAALAERRRCGGTTPASRAGRARAARRGSAPSASSCVRPASSPASSFIRPSGPITVSSGRPWSRPISKSSRIVARA